MENLRLENLYKSLVRSEYIAKILMDKKKYSVVDLAKLVCNSHRLTIDEKIEWINFLSKYINSTYGKRYNKNYYFSLIMELDDIVEYFQTTVLNEYKNFIVSDKDLYRFILTTTSNKSYQYEILEEAYEFKSEENDSILRIDKIFNPDKVSEMINLTTVNDEVDKSGIAGSFIYNEGKQIFVSSKFVNYVIESPIDIFMGDVLISKVTDHVYIPTDNKMSKSACFSDLSMPAYLLSQNNGIEYIKSISLIDDDFYVPNKDDQWNRLYPFGFGWDIRQLCRNKKYSSLNDIEKVFKSHNWWRDHGNNDKFGTGILEIDITVQE